ncbi:MAG: lactonase family protein [Pyrinomonadaceae bacterium]
MSNDKWKMNRFTRRDFLKTGAIGALGAFAFRGTAWPKQRARELTLYVGTYTSGKSEGIYIYRMDRDTGELVRFNSIKAVNPSFLTIDQSRRNLYAVNEVGEFAGQSSGAVSAFAIDSRTGNLTFLNQQASLGADPCYLTVDRYRKFLLVANYTGGNLSVLPIQRDGMLGPATNFVQHEGSSIKDQQKGPHAHCIILDHANRHALAADLGIDKVMIYRYDASTGKLKPHNQPWAQVNPGAGPHHLTLHPRGRYAYVINELDSTMTVFRYDRAKGTLGLLETVSTLPGDFSGQSYCADLHVSPSGRFLYGSNRGHNSIVVFAINENTGRLKYVEHMATQGKWPRNFTIDPTGRFLLVANQHTDNVVTFRVDAQTGRLKPTGHVAEIPVPVCLKFT